MFLTKKHLSRRTFLKGAGVSLALPFLDAMVPAATALAKTAAAKNLRVGFFYLPHGMIMNNTVHGPAMDRWTPSGNGPTFKLNVITQSLEPYQKYHKIFIRLFGDGAKAQAAKENESLLDLIKDRTQALKRDLSPSDRAVLDDYLTSVRKVEQDVQSQRKRDLRNIKLPPNPKAPLDRFDEQVRLMFELIAIAYQADLTREQINIGIKLKDGLPYTEWSKEQMKTRRANGGREDPHTYCMPPNFPRAWTLPQHSRMVQTPGIMAVLHEFNGAYREVYLDGRPLPVNPNPTWNGYSTGHWDGDSLVIETNGIRDDMWLDIQGSPITESAHVTERLKRLNFGLMQIEITVDDPKAYTKPWSVTIEMAVHVDTQMLEEICLDNEKDTKLYKK